MRRTKIVATVGPATDRSDRLAAIVRAGADAFRLNFSHGTDAEHRATLRRMHRAAAAVRRDIAVIADVQGPKIRLGDLGSPTVSLVTGQRWVLDRDPSPGDGRRVSVELPSFGHAARRGDPILLGDGAAELRVDHVDARSIDTTVVSGGTVSAHAGIYLPRARLRVDVFAGKDRRDAALGLEEGIDYLALSFVRGPEDIRRARVWLDDRPDGREVGIIAKIERAEALDAIDEILDAADGIMVARGDLGIEVPLERLALEQKRLVRKANVAGRFAIVATQMLLSMLTSPRPTRAEATDVANAVLDGADAVMLSEESAVGRYPVESVEWLARIAVATEPAYDPRGLREAIGGRDGTGAESRAVAAAAVTLAEGVGGRAIATPTHTGRTARTVAMFRPRVPVIALCHQASVRRRLALTRGVLTRTSPPHRSLIELRREVARAFVGPDFEGNGPVVLTAGYPVEGRPTNLVTLVDAEPGRGRRGRRGVR